MRPVNYNEIKMKIRLNFTTCGTLEFLNLYAGKIVYLLVIVSIESLNLQTHFIFFKSCFIYFFSSKLLKILDFFVFLQFVCYIK